MLPARYDDDDDYYLCSLTRRQQIHKALHPKDDRDRLYVSEKKEEEDSPGLEMHPFEESRTTLKRTKKD